MRWSLRMASCMVCAVLAGAAVAQQAGEEAPDLRVPKSSKASSEKDFISLFDLHPGRILVLYYWSGLHSPSLDYFSSLNNLDEKYGPRGVTIVGICRQKEEAVKKVIEERKPIFEIVFWPGLGSISDYRRIWRFPAPGITYIIDAHRRIAYARFDATDPRENLEEKIQAVLAKTPTLAATDELAKRNTQRLLELIAKQDFGRAYTLARAFKGFYRDKADAEQEEQTDELLRQISLGAYKQLESAREDLKAENHEEAARKLAELSVRLTGLDDDKDSKGKRRPSRSSSRSRSKRGAAQQTESKDFREMREEVEREIGRMQSDNYTKALVLKALDNARGEVRNDEAAEFMEAGQYSDARQKYRSVLDDFPDTAAAQKAEEELDRIENDAEMRKEILKAQATEQAERWYDLGDRFARAEMFDKAREFFEKVIKEYPDSTSAQNARDRLARLEDDEQAAREGRQRREKVTAKKDDTKVIEQARAVLQKLIDADYKGFVEAGDDKLRAAFSEKQARQTWSELQAKLGKFKSVDQGKATRVEGNEAVTFVVRFERGTQGMRIVFNAEGQMAGFNLVTP